MCVCVINFVNQDNIDNEQQKVVNQLKTIEVLNE